MYIAGWITQAITHFCVQKWLTVPPPILAAIGLRPRRGAITRGRMLIRGLRAALGASPAWAAALERCGEDRPDGVRFRNQPGTTR